MRKEKGKGKEKGKEKEKGKKGKGKGLAPYDVVQSHFISYLHLDSKKILPLRRRQSSTNIPNTNNKRCYGHGSSTTQN